MTSESFQDPEMARVRVFSRLSLFEGRLFPEINNASLVDILKATKLSFPDKVCVAIFKTSQEVVFESNFNKLFNKHSIRIHSPSGDIVIPGALDYCDPYGRVFYDSFTGCAYRSEIALHDEHIEEDQLYLVRNLRMSWHRSPPEPVVTNVVKCKDFVGLIQLSEMTLEGVRKRIQANRLISEETKVVRY